ncbi:hypothetical protein ACFL1G_07060 [Planctomycetota bacterium]
MKLQSVVTDNITELLVKIIKFTRARQKILVRNINSVNIRGFKPKELSVGDFSSLLNNAINEHIENRRLVLCDTENIKFGIGGSVEIKAVTDKFAQYVLKKSRNAYLELQIDKLMENSLNQKIAAVLLRQKNTSFENSD